MKINWVAGFTLALILAQDSVQVTPFCDKESANPQNGCEICAKQHFKYWNGGFICKLCPEECTSCLSASFCTECQTSFYLSQSLSYSGSGSSSCKKCPAGCQKCQNTSQDPNSDLVCTVCDEGYFLRDYRSCISDYNFTGFIATLFVLMLLVSQVLF